MKQVQVKSLKKSETRLSQVSSHMKQVKSWVIWNKFKSSQKSTETSTMQLSRHLQKVKSSLESVEVKSEVSWNQFMFSLSSFEIRSSQVPSHICDLHDFNTSPCRSAFTICGCRFCSRCECVALTCEGGWRADRGGGIGREAVVRVVWRVDLK